MTTRTGFASVTYAVRAVTVHFTDIKSGPLNQLWLNNTLPLRNWINARYALILIPPYDNKCLLAILFHFKIITGFVLQHHDDYENDSRLWFVNNQIEQASILSLSLKPPVSSKDLFLPLMFRIKSKIVEVHDSGIFRDLNISLETSYSFLFSLVNFPDEWHLLWNPNLNDLSNSSKINVWVSVGRSPSVYDLRYARIYKRLVDCLVVFQYRWSVTVAYILL
jgi:hypothetical protein